MNKLTIKVRGERGWPITTLTFPIDIEKARIIDRREYARSFADTVEEMMKELNPKEDKPHVTDMNISINLLEPHPLNKV